MSKPAILFGFAASVTVAVVVAVRGTSGVEDRASGDQQKRDEPNRSPLAVAVHSNGRLCATANFTAGTISFVDLKTGGILREHRCGNGPADVKWIDADRLIVSLLHDDAVAVVRFDRKTNAASTVTRISVGDEPRGIALRDARLAFVAVTNFDQVAVVDLKANTVVRRLPVGGHPRTLAVSPDGGWLVTCCNVPGRVYVHDAR
ncbi:MAG: YncE family protein, partial [Planctomycetaceae bacterium]